MKQQVVALGLYPRRRQAASLVSVDLAEAVINSFHWVASVAQKGKGELQGKAGRWGEGGGSLVWGQGRGW